MCVFFGVCVCGGEAKHCPRRTELAWCGAAAGYAAAFCAEGARLVAVVMFARGRMVAATRTYPAGVAAGRHDPATLAA